MFHFMKTLNLLDQCSTLRAQLTLMDFSGGSDGKESALNVRERPGFYPWVWKIPWRREQQATPVFLPEQSHGQRSPVGYSLWDPKKLEPFSKHSTLAVRALTYEFEEHTFSPQYYLT